jgi:DNA polymerase III delta subunit
VSAERRADPGPAETLAGLLAELGRSPVRRAYLLRGEERYFRERAIQALRARAAEQGWEVALHDAQGGNPDFRLERLIEDLSGGGGLFCAHRLVVVRHPEEILRKSGDAEAAFLRAALAFLGASEEGGALVLSAESLRADSPLAKAVAGKGGAVLAFRRLYASPPPWSPDPRRAELVQWTLGRARELGLRLVPESAVYLCAAVGNDLFALEGEMERLRQLPPQDLRELVEWQAASPPWNVAEWIVQGDLPRALSGIETLFRSGFQERGKKLLDATALSAMTIASLGREVRRSLALALSSEAGADPMEAAAGLGPKGKAQEALLQRTMRADAATWRARERDVADLERRAKSATEVDANDFVALALRWASPGADPRASTRAGPRAGTGARPVERPVERRTRS